MYNSVLFWCLSLCVIENICEDQCNGDFTKPNKLIDEFPKLEMKSQKPPEFSKSGRVLAVNSSWCPAEREEAGAEKKRQEDSNITLGNMN